MIIKEFQITELFDTYSTNTYEGVETARLWKKLKIQGCEYVTYGVPDSLWAAGVEHEDIRSEGEQS